MVEQLISKPFSSCHRTVQKDTTCGQTTFKWASFGCFSKIKGPLHLVKRLNPPPPPTMAMTQFGPPKIRLASVPPKQTIDKNCYFRMADGICLNARRKPTMSLFCEPLTYYSFPYSKYPLLFVGILGKTWFLMENASATINSGPNKLVVSFWLAFKPPKKEKKKKKRKKKRVCLKTGIPDITFLFFSFRLTQP